MRLLLAHLGIPYERIELDVIDRSNRRAVLGDKNPDLRVPVLVLDDGRALAESDAILFYLAEGTQYLPADRFERAQVLQWSFFEQYSHEPNIAVARFWVSILKKPDPQRLEEKQQGGYRALDAMEAHLSARTYLVGERYTIADIALYAYTHVAGEGGFEMGRYPAVRAWLARVAAQPGHVTIDS
ncbi:MAG TPA: glutathione S-transferase family protein [Candidatus Polarisedimenticolia bacterium]|nr:glutathione S-transferase family protein [Candidatus Polarisedimenticolia bacterium]